MVDGVANDHFRLPVILNAVKNRINNQAVLRAILNSVYTTFRMTFIVLETAFYTVVFFVQNI